MLDTKKLFAEYNQQLTDAIIEQEDFKRARASGNLERFLLSSESVLIKEDRFIKYVPSYAPTVDAGISKQESRKKDFRELRLELFEWLKYKKYGLSYANNKERVSLSYALAKNQRKKGSFKFRNSQAKTRIFEKAIRNTLPTLRDSIRQEAIFTVQSQTGAEIREINKLSNGSNID